MLPDDDMREPLRRDDDRRELRAELLLGAGTAADVIVDETFIAELRDRAARATNG